jgi:hypothetical protein
LDELLFPFETFRKFCGNECPARVALVLTMCEKGNSTTYQIRKEYLTNYWKEMVGENAAVYSHYGTKKSAWDVVTALTFRSTILPNLWESVYSALTTFETGISPWTHPSEWLDVNTKHIRSIFDGIVFTAHDDIKPITFPETMIFQVC